MNIHRHFLHTTEAEVWNLPDRLFLRDISDIARIRRLFYGIGEPEEKKETFGEDGDPVLTEKEEKFWGIKNPREATRK